jgi:pyruvate/2-oxoglutarate/acetoin dehydrogenase E1 component
MTTYKDELTKAMTYLGEQEDTRFVGQQIVYPGNPMSATLENVSKDKMTEVPVMEEAQMGMSLGMAMTGLSVVTIYPRWDFLISATNQLVNHLDKYELMTGKKASVIIRVGKGADEPLDPGHQHKGNYYNEFQSLCPSITFHEFTSSSDIFETYKAAYEQGGVHLMLEYPQLYVA